MSGSDERLSAVMQALSTVIEPELHRDLVSLNMVKDVTITGDAVSLTVVLTTPACPMKGRIREMVVSAVLMVPGITSVSVNFGAQVRKAPGLNPELTRGIRNVIAISSGKGGVGKSTVAVNLAIALAGMGASVGLLDADILGPSIPTMMGLHLPPAMKDEKLIPLSAYGVSVMSMGFLMEPDTPVIWRGPMLHGALQQLFSDVDWGDLDYLVVDLPPGTGDVQLSLAQSIPMTGAVVVTQPMQVAVADAARGLVMFQKLNVHLLGVIENMSGELFGEGGGEQLATRYKLPMLGSVPLEAGVRVSGDAGSPVVISAPESPAARAFVTIASNLAAQVSMRAFSDSGFIPLDQIGMGR